MQEEINLTSKLIPFIAVCFQGSENNIKSSDLLFVQRASHFSNYSSLFKTYFLRIDHKTIMSMSLLFPVF